MAQGDLDNNRRQPTKRTAAPAPKGAASRAQRSNASAYQRSASAKHASRIASENVNAKNIAGNGQKRSRQSQRRPNDTSRVARPTRAAASKAPNKNALTQRGNRGNARKQAASAEPENYRFMSLWSSQQYSGNASSAKSGKADPRRENSIPARVLSVLAALAALIARGATAVGKAWLMLVRSNKVAGIASAVVVLVLAVFLFDGITTAGKAYSGVKIGSIDVSGMNEQQMRSALQTAYVDPFESATVTVYASDEAAAKTTQAIQEQEEQNAAVAEQLAVEEAISSKEAWQASAQSLKGCIDVDKAIDEALAVGRENGGFFGRLAAQFSGSTITLSSSLDSECLDDFAKEIDATIGTERIDYDVQIYNGYASITEGNDGWMIDRDSFGKQILAAFMPDSAESSSLVAHTDYTPIRVDEQAASKAAENINTLLSNGCTITYENAEWEPSAKQLGSWITTTVAQTDGGWSLYASIDAAAMNSTAVRELQSAAGTTPSKISYEVNGDSVTVKTDGESKIPDVGDLADKLGNALFGKGDAVSGSTFATAAPEVAVSQTEVPGELSFDDALDRGVIGVVGTYTTEFTTGSGTENRNHNIALVSELLTNSVVTPGNIWSYNDTTGDCDESKGFLGAGAIVAGEYTDSVGGGICQVATTVFNAVYESGLPITERHNHSLYISSYPQGRDAAVSYDELDLRWENDTESDILVRVSTSTGSVTATLYGIDPGYQVSTETGQWEAGEEYSTITKVDDSLAPGTRYVKTVGSNGSSIDVTRTVKDSDGNVVRTDLFASVYDPKDQVIVTGPSSSAG
jgi:hypothetical protein